MRQLRSLSNIQVTYNGTNIKKSSQKHGFEGNNLSNSSGSVKFFMAMRREQGRCTGKGESIAGPLGCSARFTTGVDILSVYFKLVRSEELDWRSVPVRHRLEFLQTTGLGRPTECIRQDWKVRHMVQVVAWKV